MTSWFFDLDGTLADTAPDIRACWRQTIVDLGLDRARFDRLFVIGPSIDEAIRLMYPECHTPELVAAVRDGFAAHYDTGDFPLTREYPGVLDRVRELKAGGARVFIVTNKRFVATRLMARHFGWDRVFDGLYAGDMHKDDPIGRLRKPELLALVLKERGIRPEDAVMVGDTINDFEAAKANGVRSIGVAWGYGTTEELTQADLVVSNPERLVEGALAFCGRGGPHRVEIDVKPSFLTRWGPSRPRHKPQINKTKLHPLVERTNGVVTESEDA